METAHELDGAAATLAALARLRRTRMEVERDIIAAAVNYADIRNGETARSGSGYADRAMPGMERSVRIGGSGTPEVAEFAAADVAAELETSPFTARLLMADGLDIRHRLPKLWKRLLDCEVPVWVARKIAASTRDLTAEGAALVDGRIAPYADGRLSWSRLFEVLDAAVMDADPEAAAERERRAAEEKFAKVGRSNDHGQKTLYVRDHAATIIRVDATISFIAEALRALGDPDDENTRRVKALAVMANPLQAVQLLAAYRAGCGVTDDDPGTTDEPLPTDFPEPGPGPEPGPQPGPDDGTGENVMPTLDPEADESAAPASGPADSPAPVKPDPFRPSPFRPSDIPCCPHAQGRQDGPSAGGGGYTVDWARLLPSVTLYLHLAVRPPDGQRSAAGTDSDSAGEPCVGNVVRWEGEGPITTQYVRDVLGPLCRFTVKPLIDLNDHVAVTAYETPDWMRERVHLITGGDVYPYASSSRRNVDLDHVEPYVPPDDGGPPGQTNPGNLAPMTRFHHRLKTHGGWKLRELFPGTYLWRSPHGSVFLVDNTGTRKVSDRWSMPFALDLEGDGRAVGLPNAPAEGPASPAEQRFAAYILAG